MSTPLLCIFTSLSFRFLALTHEILLCVPQQVQSLQTELDREVAFCARESVQSLSNAAPASAGGQAGLASTRKIAPRAGCGQGFF